MAERHFPHTGERLERSPPAGTRLKPSRLPIASRVRGVTNQDAQFLAGRLRCIPDIRFPRI